jgi:hypothetical protein
MVYEEIAGDRTRGTSICQAAPQVAVVFSRSLSAGFGCAKKAYPKQLVSSRRFIQGNVSIGDT